MKRITFLIPYALNTAPSQRFRFEFFLDELERIYQVDIHTFYSKKGYNFIRSKKYHLLLPIVLFWGFLRRCQHIFKCFKADFVFIHRETTPIGPPWVEFFIARILKRKIIYDFDDAIWLPDPHESGLREKLKWKSKVARICGWSFRTSCGNDYLAEFASQYSQNVRIIPTIVNTSVHKPLNKSRQNTPPVIGWTGSSTTLVYLKSLVPLLEKIRNLNAFTLAVMADTDPGYKKPWIKFIPWSRENESRRLAEMDIGIMPLPDDPWTKGKCGFKLIQYGAVGIPSVASDVGMNRKIIDEGCTGYLCNSDEEWSAALLKLLADNTLRTTLGKAARKKIEREFSSDSVKEKFMNLFID